MRTSMLVAVVLLASDRAWSQCGEAVGLQTVHTGSPGENSGLALAAIGDIDGNGVVDVVIGSPQFDGPGSDRGRVTVVLLEASGVPKSSQTITEGDGGFTGVLDDFDGFGRSVTGLGDVNGDLIPDIAVGADGDDDGGDNFGAVWILFLDSTGSVWASQKISSTAGGLTPLPSSEGFAYASAGLGDVDKDGTPDLAVGSYRYTGSSTRQGAVRLLFLNPNGTVTAETLITEGSAGFSLPLDDDDNFGFSVTSLDDLDEDGVVDMAVGAPLDDDKSTNTGAAYILLLENDGTVKNATKINGLSPALSTPPPKGQRFTHSLTSPGDLDCDGVVDLIGFSPDTDDLYVIFLQSTGAPKAGAVATSPAPAEEFHAAAAIDDLNGDLIPDVLLGSAGQQNGGGRTYATFLSCPSAVATQRNGAGINGYTLTSMTLPIVGTTWRLDMNCIGHAPDVTLLLVYDAPTSGLFIAPGEILIDIYGGRKYRSKTLAHSGNVVQFNTPLPNDPALCGIPAYAQAICFGAPEPKLSNAVDIVVGRQ